MSYYFENEVYPTASEVQRKCFPHRSDGYVRRYLKLGCKSISEVVAMEIEIERQGRIKSKVGTKNSRFGGKAKT